MLLRGSLGWTFLLHRLGYFAHCLVGSGANLAQNLHYQAHDFRHPFGAQHD
jgi:hypothetical protein